MTEAQKETLRFYTTNDYLLINGLLWGEEEKRLIFSSNSSMKMAEP